MPISVFVCDFTKDSGGKCKLQAQTFLKRLKSLRHPCIIKYIGSVEVETLLTALYSTS